MPSTRPISIPPGWRPLLAAAVVLTLTLCVIAAYRGRSIDRASSTLDFRDFWLTALEFRETGQIVADQGVHNYLPFFAIFMMPWSYLPLPAAAAVFTALSLSMAAASVVMVEILLNGKLDPRPRPATYLAILLILPYAWSAGVLGQMGMMLLFLIVGAWFVATRELEWEAGVALGLAAAVKLLPAVLIVFFLVKQRWRITVAAIGTLALLGLAVPRAMLPWREFVAQHQGFVERASGEGGAYATIHADKPRKAKFNNNGLPIVLRRLLSATDYDPLEGRAAKFINPLDVPRAGIWWIYVVLVAGIVTVSLAAVVRGGARWPPGDLDSARALQAQFGVWCALMLLASPLMWTHYLLLLYWPLALVADRAERHWRAHRKLEPVAVTALAIWLLAAVALAIPAARAAGAQLIAVFGLWAACVVWSFAPPPVEPPRSQGRRREIRQSERAGQASVDLGGPGR